MVPVLGHYAQAASELAHAGQTVASAGGAAAQQVPYDRITAKPGEIDLSLLRSITGPVARADAGVRRGASMVDHLDTSWLISPLTQRLDRYRTHLDTTLPEADRALAAVRLAPGLLGASGTRHYLVLFGNPAESRFLGGYAGAYGNLTASNGHLTLTSSGRTEDLGSSPAVPSTALAPVGWPTTLYEPVDHLGNVTASADFPALARLATTLYHDPLGEHVDGVLYVDPRGLAALLGLVGGIHVDGLDETLTETNLAQFLLHDQYTTFADRSERFDFLSATARATFQLLTTRELPTPKKLFEQLAPAVRGGHLQLWFTDPHTDPLLDSVGVSGRLAEPSAGNLFDLRTSNTSQNKADAFLHRTVQYTAQVDPKTGQVGADVTIRLQNDAPIQLPPYVLSNQWLRRREPGAPPYGSDSLLVSVSTRLSVDGAWLDGRSIRLANEPTAPGAQPDGAAHRYATSVVVPAGGAVEIRLHLHGGASPHGRYVVTFVHQPLANDDRVQLTVRRNGSSTTTGTLTLTETRPISVAVG